LAAGRPTSRAVALRTELIDLGFH